MTTRVINDASRNATLNDVARLAGVSIATASKALNGRKDVGAATRVRVVHAAEQLAFTPNALAQGLIAQRTGTVGLLTSDLEGRFAIPILMGAEDAFGAGRTSCSSATRAATPSASSTTCGPCSPAASTASSSSAPGPTSAPRSGQDLGVPVVYAYAPSDDPADLSLVTDNYGGGELAVDHLLACGRTRIAHISGDPSYGAAQDRARGGDRPAGAAPGSSWSADRSSSAPGRRTGAATPPRAAATRSGRRRDLRGLRPDRPRRAGHARPGRRGGAVRGLGHRLRQLGGARHATPARRSPPST